MPRSSHEDPAGPQCAARLLPLVYDKLRALAAGHLRRERGYQTLQPTALVHEAYLCLTALEHIEWQGKTHFYAMASTAMRRVLVDYARAARAAKRGAKPVRVTLGEGVVATNSSAFDLLALDESLRRLATESPRQCRVAELRLFSGLLVEEIADALGVSPTTVKQDWRVARAWLAADLR